MNPVGFASLFGRACEVAAEAPGRVNIIGEHTDYSGGFVLPMAIPQRTRVELALRNDRRARVCSTSMSSDEILEFEVGAESRRGDWLDYVQGTVRALRTAGHEVPGGFEARITSEVPPGSGLSSSAALEVALLRALRSALSLALDDVAVARLGQRAENDFVGAPVGIMDPMAVSLAQPRSALFLDTRSLAYERLPLPAGVEVLVIDSGVSHGHAGGEYRTRRAECERAATLLGVRELRDVSDVRRVSALPAPLDRRARHVVTENGRVLEAVRAWKRGDLALLGSLLDASHASLRVDFEVSTADVDRLVVCAQNDPDTFGARMTGGGFGGAIVALARAATGAAAASRILSDYDAGGAVRGRILVPGGGLA